MHVITTPKHPPHGETDSADASGSPTSKLTGTASAPAVPDLSVAKPRPVAEELATMIETLRIVGEELRAKWIEIAVNTTNTKHPNVIDVVALDDGTSHLLRLSSQLHSHFLDCQMRITAARRGLARRMAR